jgi:hypothetical protein
MFVIVAIILMFISFAAIILGQIIAVVCLLYGAVVLVKARHALALLPRLVLGLWFAGVLNLQFVGSGIPDGGSLIWSGRGTPRALSKSYGGAPVWWVQSLAAVTFVLTLRWPPVPSLRPSAIIGLCGLAAMGAGLAILS